MDGVPPARPHDGARGHRAARLPSWGRCWSCIARPAMCERMCWSDRRRSAQRASRPRDGLVSWSLTDGARSRCRADRDGGLRRGGIWVATADSRAPSARCWRLYGVCISAGGTRSGAREAGRSRRDESAELHRGASPALRLYRALQGCACSRLGRGGGGRGTADRQVQHRKITN